MVPRELNRCFFFTSQNKVHYPLVHEECTGALVYTKEISDNGSSFLTPTCSVNYAAVKLCALHSTMNF